MERGVDEERGGMTSDEEMRRGSERRGRTEDADVRRGKGGGIMRGRTTQER